jgi:formate-dependent nitrite reductase cytochrome c552 subunit
METGRFRRLLVAGVSSAGLVSGAALAADFLGPESCKGCHGEAYALWSVSKHARSMEALTPEQQRDPRCTACHAPNVAEQRVAAVSCETCHGGGQYYAPAYVMKDPELARLVGLLDPGERSCRSCHDAGSPSLRPFDFTSKLKAMDHWTVGRTARPTTPSSDTPAPHPR